MEEWYTLYTRPNSEYQVATSLQRRGIQTYLPATGLVTDRSGAGRKPFFPCYLFVRVDFKEVGLSRVQWTPGLRRVVAFDEHPAPVPDEAIDLIRRKVDAMNAAGGRPAPDFKPGDTVRILRGPLEGLLAIFDGPSTPAERVQVLLRFLGQASRVHIPIDDLQKSPTDTQASMSRRPRRTRGRGRPIRHSP